MNEFWDWTISIVIIALLGFTALWNVARMIYGIICFRIEECSNRDCYFKCFCNKYNEPISDEELDFLYALLEDFRKRNGG